MAIKRLKKITLYGPDHDKSRILKQLQSLGCLHLIPLTDKAVDVPVQPAEASEAKVWLERSPKQRRQIRNFRDTFRGQQETARVDDIVHKILDNKSKFREQSDIRDKLQERIREVRPWGEFAFPALSDLNGQRLWFYVMPNGELPALRESLKESELPWELIHQSQKDSYVIVVSDGEPDEVLLPAPRSHVGKIPLSRLEEMLDEAEDAIEDLLSERESLTRWNYLLDQVLAARMDSADLQQATTGTIDEDSFFLVQGWVPVSDQANVEAFTAAQGVAVIFEDPTVDDHPPTLLDKPAGTGGGSDALGFFQTPNYRAWDPGNVVFYSFSLFFAMIMSDAMYSLVFGLIIFLCRSKLKQSEAGHRLMNLAYFMSAAGIAWGVFVGSYFGVAPDSTDLLGRLAFIDLNDYNGMMKLSVIIGVSHLVIANVMKAVVNRGSSYALAPLGWAGLMAGGTTIWLGMTGTLPKAFETTIGPGLMIAGALLVFLFSSSREVKSFKDLFLRMLDGLKAVYNITGAFGDVLSYMRLFALGLSGASLAMTFNSLAMDVLHSSPVTGVLFAGIILLLGHMLNFALCIMSGVVHGMRLNVIEFVNWGLSDEGYPFKTFSKRED
ncbi:V-type ATP synthase subunit I [Endozoicomonas sp.]|uniref:V-type ATP synthase subunit I n=1 Tax=Endozoicomonas sp. TaxID=1892382 RepID=UPI002885A1A1|nr:V-type ATP synthase subunit I [Endozoicomonas sp.]